MTPLLALLAFAAQTPDPVIAGVVDAARVLHDRLPNYICRQVTTRHAGTTIRGPWKLVDTFEEQLYYFNRQESRTLTAINGKPVKRKTRPRGGLQARNLFGGMLAGIFRPEAQAQFQSEGEDVIAGRRAIRIRYRVLRENSTWKSSSGNPLRTRSYVRGFNGQVWADAKTLAVLRLTAQMEPEPGDPDFVGGTKLDMSYGFVTIGDAEHLLPVRSEVTLEVNKKPKRNTVEFSDFRQFTAESKIEFGDPR